MTTQQQHIVVIGAGYAGLSAATRAGRKHRVTLIAPEDRFLNRTRQHETFAGHPEHRPPLAELLADRQVTHKRARATELDLDARKVLLDSGETVGYDTLVYAVGSRTAWHGVPGAAEHAHPAERAAELAARMAAAPEPGTVAVVGGGLTGIELAAELAETHPAWKVRIVSAAPVGHHLSPKGRAYVRRTFERLGVEVHEGLPVTSVTAAGVRTDAGAIDADLVAWTAAMEPYELAAEAGLTVTADGRAVVDEYLRSVSHPEVHVIGDAAQVRVAGIGELRMACATALPQGGYLGDLLSGRTDKPFAFKYQVQCISLGRRDGMVQLVHPDDSMRNTVLTGALGRWTKGYIVKLIVKNLR
ncbi:NAD(P)/FAD-dependent oxidoreductase [Kitasatospora sp. NPDC096147]|uniref:NAD(P)/FAD-dependent oxidoreductase n=1 Tax=Kitasatospora sp. NPDC096147 TaxID=3364093 RepID=UPI003810765B